MTEQELQEIDRQIESHQGKAQIASAYRTMCQTAGFQDLKRELEGRIADQKNKWMTAEGDEEKRCKIRAQIYNEVFELIKTKILTGDMAARTVDQLLAQKKGE